MVDVGLIGVLGLLRAGEFAVDADLSHEERERRLLRLQHLTIAADKQSMTIHVPVTKTKPFDGINVHYAKGASAPLCPLAAWFAYATIRQASRSQRANIHRDAPLLMADDGRPIRKQQFIDQLRRVLRAAGIADDSIISRFSGHSCRRGGAQSLRDAGLAIDDIKVAGHWSSNAVLRYLSSSNTIAASLAPLFARSARGETSRSVQNNAVDSSHLSLPAALPASVSIASLRDEKRQQQARERPNSSTATSLTAHRASLPTTEHAAPIVLHLASGAQAPHRPVRPSSSICCLCAHSEHLRATPCGRQRCRQAQQPALQ